MVEIMELMGRSASTTLSGSLLLIAATTGLTVVMSEVGSNAAETSATEPKQAMFRTQAEAEAAAPQFGCKGAHQMGQMWMVCDKHGIQMESQHNP